MIPHVGDLPVAISFGGTSVYSAATATATLHVRKAVPVITWAAPPVITYGTPLSSIQLNATANVPGTFAYTPAAGTILDAGVQPLSVAFAPADTSGYQNANAATTLVVNKAPQQINWAAPAPIVYGTPLSPLQLNATVSVVGPALPGATGYIHQPGEVLDAGTQTLTVTAAETADYLPASAMVSLTVARAPLTVTPASATKTYGAALPPLTGTLAGIVNNDPITPQFTTAATVRSPVASYPISASLNDANGRLRNYIVTATAATLSVTPAPLTISVVNASKQYSRPMPAFTVTYNGFVLGETPAVLSGALAFVTTVTQFTGPGQYTIGLSGVSSPNYNITFAPGTLAVLPEDARVTYTGARLASTTGMKTASASLLLAATVADLAVSPDANGDIWPGDIRKATLTFIDRSTNATLCIAPIDLVAPGATTIATGSCIWTAPLTANTTLNVGLVVGGYYIRNSPADDVAVALQMPSDHFTAGGGFLVAANSVGTIAADAGSKINFNVEARYKSGQPSLQGRVTIDLQHTDDAGAAHAYEIALPVISSLGITADRMQATITGADATITDVTNPGKPVTLASNAIVELTTTQASKAHEATLALTVWKRAGSVWLASSWNGVQTIEQTLAGGAIQIH